MRRFLDRSASAQWVRACSYLMGWTERRGVAFIVRTQIPRASQQAVAGWHAPRYSEGMRVAPARWYVPPVGHKPVVLTTPQEGSSSISNVRIPDRLAPSNRMRPFGSALPRSGPSVLDAPACLSKTNTVNGNGTAKRSTSPARPPMAALASGDTRLPPQTQTAYPRVAPAVRVGRVTSNQAGVGRCARAARQAAWTARQAAWTARQAAWTAQPLTNLRPCRPILGPWNFRSHCTKRYCL